MRDEDETHYKKPESNQHPTYEDDPDDKQKWQLRGERKSKSKAREESTKAQKQETEQGDQTKEKETKNVLI